MKPLLSARRVFSALTIWIVCAVLLLVALYRPNQEGALSMEEASGLDVPRVRSSFSPKNQSDDAQARGFYEMVRLRDPATGAIPAGVRERELAHVRGVPRAEEVARKTGGLMTQQWSFLGPNNVGGRTRAVAYDLNYDGASNRRILAGGISGGMYLSEDDGQSWTLTSSLSEIGSVTCLAQDPANRNVWYHGTGEFTGNSAGGGIGAYLGHGMSRSNDGGRTWRPLLGTRSGQPHVFDNLWDFVWNVAVHPGGAVLAATFGGIHRSTDGGETWTYVLGRQAQEDPFNSITDVAITPSGTAYATLSRNGSGASRYGVFKSANAGQTWESINPPGLSNDPYRMVLGTAPSDANTIYLLVQANQQGARSSDHQLFRYNDGAGSWTNLSGSLPNETGAEGNASFTTQGGYDQVVRVKPDDPNTVFIGGTNLYRSTDGGSTFTRIGGYNGPANYNLYPNHHADQHALVFNPVNPNVAISGHDGGVARSANILAQPHNWQSLNNGYITTQFYTIAMDPRAGGASVIGGLQDKGTWGTQSTNPLEAWFDLFGGDGSHAAITPGATAFYVSAQNGLTFRLTARSFANVTPAGASRFMFVNPFVLDPNDAKVMYMGENGGVWRNSNLEQIPDGNQTPTSVNWTFLSGSAQPNMFTTTLSMAKTPANRLYFGATNFQSQTVLIRVDNTPANGSGGNIMPPVTSQGLAPFPSSVAVHPGNGDEIIAVFSNYSIESIWHSSNAGGSWTNIGGNIGGVNGPSVRSTAIVPAGGGTMYFVGTSTGLYSTSALAGANTVWVHEGSDVLGNVVVDMLAVRPEDGVLIAGTHGRGAYRAVIGEGAAAVAELDVAALDLAVRPGATISTTFRLTNTGNADLTFTVGAAGKTSQEDPPHRLREDVVPLRPPVPKSFREGGPLPHPVPANTAGGAPFDASNGDIIILDDGDDWPDDFFGWGDGVTPFQWLSRFVAPPGGFTLRSFYVHMRSEALSLFPVSVFITDPDGSVFVSGSVNLPTSNQGSWYRITFDPIELTQGQTFDIELRTPGSVLFPAGVDQIGRAAGAGYYWVNASTGGWYASLSGISGYENGAWLIRAEGTVGGGSTNQPPTANIVVSKMQALVGENITFDGSASTDPDGTITQYGWAFGDGATADEPVVQHAYEQPGVYGATLTVTDNEGATGQASRQITITSDNQPPVAQIQASTTTPLVNEEMVFEGSGSYDPDGNIVGYAWEFGDGNTASTEVARHTYIQAGVYTVRLRVTDNKSATGQATLQVTVLAEPSRLTVSPPTGTIRPGESMTITVAYDATTQSVGTYSGQITLATNGGNFVIPVAIRVDLTVDVEPPTDLPASIALAQNYPNPFNPGTTIQFALERPAYVRLTVFDVSGRPVLTLLEGNRSAGAHQVTWEGDDASGRALASGTYFYRLEAFEPGGRLLSHYTRKMVLLR
jgi:chitodextrinase